jgi:hypothetical protein
VKRNGRTRVSRMLSLALLLGLSPLLMGASEGCQAFRDSFATSLETATAAAVNAALSNLFDQFQSDSP